MIGMGTTAALWGVALWVFFNTTEILPRFYMIVIVCGMNAGAVRSLASVPVATVVYVVFTMSPLTVRTSVRSDADALIWTVPLTVPIVNEPAWTPDAITLPLTACGWLQLSPGNVPKSRIDGDDPLRS